MKIYEVKEKVAENARKVTAFALPAVTTTALTLTSFAEETGVVAQAEGDADVIQTTITAMTTSLTNIATGIGTMIGSVLPIIIPIAGIGIVVSVGFAIVKRITRQS